jgi:hypothetical protein
MKRSWFLRIFLLGLPFLVAGAAVAALPVYRYVAEGRPLCLPELPRRGDDPPQEAARLPAGLESDIPEQDDWVDYGPVLEAGQEGEWDFYWAGITPASVVKKDGTIYFYYVAADGYRSFDGDARHRAVGVATSTDGIRFAKYEGNPIMTHRPYDGEEEGANSAAVTLDENGRFVMVYGAASGPESSIVADARFAYSEDGLHFADAGLALDHCNLSLYGAGDEIFPVALLRQPDRWVVYYYPNGVGDKSRTLGAAWGRELDQLGNSTVVLDGASGGWPVSGWGNVITTDDGALLLFAQRNGWPDTFVEARLASPATPYRTGEPLTRYDIPDLQRGIVFLDQERRTWFMYYSDFGRFWHLKLAPYGEPDATPPSTPQVSPQSASDSSVSLSWQEATDMEIGVVEYRIYRDGRFLGSTRDTTWRDEQLRPGSSYRYAVSAVNFHGVESPAGEVVVRTLADRTPPRVEHVYLSQDLATVQITFSEPVEQHIATNSDNYAIGHAISIRRASLTDGGRTVVLETTAHTAGELYDVAVSGVVDRAQPGNRIAPATVAYGASTVGGLAGRWIAGEAHDAAEDLAGYGVRALVAGPARAAEQPEALVFDGVDDYIQMPGDNHLQSITSGSFSFLAWIRAEALPTSRNGAYILGRVGEHPWGSFVGIALTPGGRFQATILPESQEAIRVTSSPVALEQWHHVAMVVDVVEGTLSLFVDGTTGQEGIQSFAGSLLDLSSEAPRDDRSGAYFVGSTMPDRGAGDFFAGYFQGTIRDVRIYSQALSAGDIQTVRQE